MPVINDCSSIKYVMPYVIRWPFNHEHALELTQQEIEAFQVDHEDGCPYQMNRNGLLPCPLHAWGSQLRACPCRCRSGPLSTDRLMNKGLFGVVIESAFDGSGLSRWRHIHPSECGALVGLDPVADYGEQVSLTLSAIGQIASPIHALWVGSHVINHFRWIQDGIKLYDPWDHLHAYRSWLLARCQLLWPTPNAMHRNQLTRDAVQWESVAHDTLHSLLHLDEWDFLMTERCLATVLAQLKEQRSLGSGVPDAEAFPLHDEVSRSSDDMNDSEEPEPEAVEPYAEPPRFHVVEVPTGCAAVMYPPHHDVAFVRVSESTTVRELMEAEGRLYGFEWSHVTAFKSDGTRWEMNEIIQPGKLAQFCVIHDSDPHATHACARHVRLDGFPGECGQRPIPMMLEPPTGEYGLLPYKLPVNDAAHALCLANAQEWKPQEQAVAPRSLGESGPLPFRLPDEVHGDKSQPAAQVTHAFTETGESGPLPFRLPDDGHWSADDPSRSRTPGDDPLDALMLGESRPLPFKLPGQERLVDLPADAKDASTLLKEDSDAVRTNLRPQNMHPLHEDDSKYRCHVTVPREPHESLPHGPLPTSVPVASADAGRDALNDTASAPKVEPGASRPSPQVSSAASGSCVPRSPLIHLDAVSLVKLQCSFPTTQPVVNSMKQQVITVADRKAILDRQGLLWADDEIAWHLANLQALCQSHLSVVVIDPLLVYGWLNVGFDNFGAWMQQYCPTACCLATVAFAHNHWIPIFLQPMNGTLYAHTWDAQDADHGGLDTLFVHVYGHFGLTQHQHVRQVRLFDMNEGCGAMAIGFLAHMMLSRKLPTDSHEVVEFHLQLRAKFAAQGLQGTTCPKPWLWGNGTISQIEGELAPFLIQHGVPAEQATNRAKAALRAIGAPAIEEALASKIPWKQLKTLGNQVKFQFLLPAELKEKVAKSAGQGAVGRPKGGKKSKKTTADPEPLDLDPSKFALQPGTFHAAGHPLSQLMLKDVGPLAEGVAFATRKEAEPYLKHGQPVSKVPLALLVPQSNLHDITTALPHTQVTVPCHCTINNEPMLVDVVLVQIGVGFVEKTPSPAPLHVETVEVNTIKFVVFRDEIEGSWESFIQGTMKYIVHHLPILRLCKEQPCKCPHWHNHEGIATTDAIHDVWRRQFLQAGYRPEAAASAVMFGVFVRTPKCLTLPLLRLSGTAGIYAEPRTPDGRSVDDTYAIVWMSKMGREALNHVCQTNPSAIGVARVGERVGLRTTAAEAPELSHHVRPGSVYLPFGPKQQFLAGPWPFGSDRNNILKALKAMNWEARPLQPLASVDNKGSMWLIQATHEPPVRVVPMSHGDIVISTHKAPRETKVQPVRPVASSATLALCGTQAPSAGSTDPWIVSDPWGGYAPTSKPAVDPSAGLQQIKTQIKEDVLASLPHQPCSMETDDTVDRIQHLEAQVHTLMQKQVSLETNVMETASRQSAQIASVQTQLQTQGQELQGHIESQQQNLQALFEAQMSQIRSLLKRPRDENE